MPSVISIRDDFAIEKSHIAIVAEFTDEDNEDVIPNSVTWTLTDGSGTIVNSREDEVITPAAAVTIVLSGADLAILAGESGDAVYRILTVNAVIDSDLGNNLPVRDSVKFPLRNLVAVT